MAGCVARQIGRRAHAAAWAALAILLASAAQAACPLVGTNINVGPLVTTAGTRTVSTTPDQTYTIVGAISGEGIAFDNNVGQAPNISVNLAGAAVTSTTGGLSVSTEGTGNVCYDGSVGSLIQAGGGLFFSGLTVTAVQGNATATVAHNIANSGDAIVVISNSGAASLTVDAGTISGVDSAVFAAVNAGSGNASVVLNGGTFESTDVLSSAVSVYNAGTGLASLFVDNDVTINGGYIAAQVVRDTGDILITGNGVSLPGAGITGGTWGLSGTTYNGAGSVTVGTAAARIGDVTGGQAAIVGSARDGDVNIYVAGTATATFTTSVGIYGGVGGTGGSGNVTIDTIGNVNGGAAGIAASINSPTTGDILIRTGAGTTITVSEDDGIGIDAARVAFGGINPSGVINIINAASIVMQGADSLGIQAVMCDCTSGSVSVMNSADIVAYFGITAVGSTSVVVQHVAGTISNPAALGLTFGIAAGGTDPVTLLDTVPVSITVAAGASIISPFGIVAGDPFSFGIPENPATIVVAGTIESTGSAAISLSGAPVNRVELHPTYQIMGIVSGILGIEDTLALGGAGARTFDLPLLTTQFIDFEKLEKAGTSTWTLTGTDPFAGATSITGGILSLGTGASLPNSAVTVTGGTIAGNGTIGSLALMAGSTLSPGNSIGTINVNGPVSFAPGSVYAVEVTPTASDLTIAQSSTITGGTVNVTMLPGSYGLTQQYTILQTTNGVTGTFSGVSVNPATFAASLSYPANLVVLTLTGVAGEIHPSLLGTFIDSDQLRPAALDRTADAMEVTGATPNAFVAPAALLPEIPGKALWGRAYGAMGSILGDGTAATLNYADGGIFAGTDGELEGWTLGVLAGYGQTHASIPVRTATASTHDFSVGLYGGQTFGPGSLKFGAGYTHHLVSTRAGTPAAGVITASYNAGLAQAFAEIDGTIDLGAQEITPFAGAAALAAGNAAFTESGGPGALSVAASTFGAIVTDAGVRLAHHFTVGDGRLVTVRGSAAWRHTFSGDPLVTASFGGVGGSFAVTGLSPVADALILTGGLDMAVSDTMSIDLSYRGQVSAGSQSHSATATLAASF